MSKFDISQNIRANIAALSPYSCARDEFDGFDALFLDANENPYDSGYNRYPDPRQRELKARLAEIKGVAAERMVIGNGSDEIIDMLIRSICEPGCDSIVVFEPGYSMYKVCADINNVGVYSLSLNQEFLPDWEALGAALLVDSNIKIVFICTPNNPIGKSVPLPQIIELCKSFNGWVVVDEAYIDFAEQGSMSSYLDEFKNLVVMQTLSKAWGMAGLRLGICMADVELVNVLNKVKYPYNVNCISQKIALDLLSNVESFEARVQQVKSERSRLAQLFINRGYFDKVWEFDGNFLLVSLPRFSELYGYLAERGVVVRKRDIPPLIPNSLRITIGTPLQNEVLVELIDNFMNGDVL